MSAFNNTILDAIQSHLPNCPIEITDKFLIYLQLPSEEIIIHAKYTLNKPYGKNHILFDEGIIGLSFAQLEPDKSTSLHYHDKRKEFFCVRRGELTLSKGPNTYFLKENEYNFSTPGEAHSLANRSKEPLEILELF